MLSRLRLFVAGTLLGPSLFSSGVVSVYAHEVANDEQCPKFKFIGKKAEVENDSGPKKEKKERCVSVKAAAIGVAGGGALASAGFYGSRLICDALKEPERKMYVTYVDYLGRNGNIFAIYDSDWGVNLMMFSTAEQREDFVRKHNFIDVCLIDSILTGCFRTNNVGSRKKIVIFGKFSAGNLINISPISNCSCRSQVTTSEQRHRAQAKHNSKVLQFFPC